MIEFYSSKSTKNKMEKNKTLPKEELEKNDVKEDVEEK